MANIGCGKGGFRSGSPRLTGIPFLVLFEGLDEVEILKRIEGIQGYG